MVAELVARVVALAKWAAVAAVVVRSAQPATLAAALELRAKALAAVLAAPTSRHTETAVVVAALGLWALTLEPPLVVALDLPIQFLAVLSIMPVAAPVAVRLAAAAMVVVEQQAAAMEPLIPAAEPAVVLVALGVATAARAL